MLRAVGCDLPFQTHLSVPIQARPGGAEAQASSTGLCGSMNGELLQGKAQGLTLHAQGTVRLPETLSSLNTAQGSLLRLSLLLPVLGTAEVAEQQ